MYRRRNEFEMMNQTSCWATWPNDFDDISPHNFDNFVFSTFFKSFYFFIVKLNQGCMVDCFNKDLPPAILQPFKIWYVELQGGYP